MGRSVLVDVANVMTLINNGHEPLAKTLKKMHDDGVNLYYDEQGYREAVTNNPRQMEAEANRQTLQDLGFKLSPQGNQEFRTDFHTLNSAGGKAAFLQDGASFQKNKDEESSQRKTMVESKGLGNLRDAGIAATAYANNFEVLSLDATFASPGERQRQLSQRFSGEITTRVMDVHDTSSAGQARVYKRTGRGLLIAPESISLFGTRPPNSSTDFNLGRRNLGLAPYTRAGKGKPVGPMSVGTPGMADHEATQLKMMGGIIALGAIVSWLDDYCIERDMKKDVAEWESYIRTRQPMDPENGFLLVAIIKKWQPRDAAYATRSYVAMEMFEAYSLATAEANANKHILGGLVPPTDTVSYIYQKMWIPPLQSRPTITAEQADERAYGRETWYPRFRLVRHSLEPPPSIGEALGVLQGSSVFDILRVLDALPAPQFALLKDNLNVVREATNRSRFRIAFAAVETHKSSSNFGSTVFLQDQQLADDYRALGSDFDRACITDWVNAGPGAAQHQMTGKWEVTLNGQRFEYSFRISGTVVWRDANNAGSIGGEGDWTVTPSDIRVQWPKSGTIETFPLPINPDRQKARCSMKSGTFDMTARKTNPYP